MACGKCKSGKYCSKLCQKKHFPDHSKYCSAISDLEKLELHKLYRDSSVREEQVDGKTQTKLLNLIGEKPLLKCKLDGKDAEVLWDTGSMVSLVDTEWIKKHFPGKKLHSIEEFLQNQTLQIRAANSSEISFEGVLLFDFSLQCDSKTVTVPFLVTSQKISEPILGYNVIEYLVVQGYGTNESLKSSFSVDICTNKIDNMIKVIEEKAKSPDALYDVKIPDTMVISAGRRSTIRCKVKVLLKKNEQTVFFKPKFQENVGDDVSFSEGLFTVQRGRTQYILIEAMNPTKKDIILKKGEVVGEICSVSAVIPMRLQTSGKQGNDEREVSGDKVNVSSADCTTDSNQNLNSDEKFLPKIDLSHLSQEQKVLMEELLIEECEVFSKTESDIGDIKDFEMKINLSDEIPVKEAYRHLPRNLYDEVRNYVNDLLVNGWIQESFSAYASPIVCVRKKDNSLRMCIDYRKLNNKTIPDSQPIPRIQDLLDNLHGQTWFSTLDMSKAYHQGYIAEESRRYTAFSTPWVLFEWVRIPFGLRNAPAAFQRYVNKSLGDLNHNICEPYLDDILCYGRTFEDHINNLKQVLQRLKAHGIKLRADKCNFMKPEVRYLGRLVSANGYRPDPKETVALEKFRCPPKNVGELRSLLGFLGYYRSFVKDFAKLMKPLYDLLKSDKSESDSKTPKSKPSRSKSKKGQRYDAKCPINWDSELQRILDNMIDYLQSPEVIAYPDFKLPFFMTCDACKEGLGAVLYQKQDGINRVISFASRTLTDTERNYNLHSGKLEFLALKWAITDKFSDYLRYGPKFMVYTDNNPLTYVLTTARLNAVGLRWVGELANYDFSIKYRPGRVHIDSDYLSRNATSIDELIKCCTEVCEPEKIDCVMSAVTADPGMLLNVSVEKLTLKPDGDLQMVEKADLVRGQKEDDIIGPVYEAVMQGRRPGKSGWKELKRGSKLLMHHFRKLEFQNDVLVRKTVSGSQIVLPERFHNIVYTELHENLAHLCPEKVIDLAQQRFYWPYMAKQITHYIRKKCRCIISKKPNIPERAPLVPMQANHPFEVVAIDFLKLDKATGGFQYVLVVSDLFTRYTQAYATRSKSSKAAADKLFHEFILQYGFPKRVHHDRGGEFNSSLFKELHRLAGMKVSNTTPYHPMGNGQVERLNCTFCNMLKTLSENDKRHWNKHLSKLAFAYNSTVNKSTGFSPFYLMFGRKSILPIDYVFKKEGQSDLKNRSYREYVDEWVSAMQEAFRIAENQMKKSSDYNKQYYDKKVKETEILPGDHVLVRNVREKGGTGKLKNYWEQSIFKVVDRDKNLPVYTLKNLNKNSDKRVLHRNLLMKCNDLPLEMFQTKDVNQPKPKKQTDERNVNPPKPNKEADERKLSGGFDVNSEDEDFEVRITHYPRISRETGGGETELQVEDGETNVSEDEHVNVVEEEHEPDAEDDSHEEDELHLQDEESEEIDTESDREVVSEHSDSEAEEVPVRRPVRIRCKKKIFTYNKIGGNPIIQ